jgi:hypothetical protein
MASPGYPVALCPRSATWGRGGVRALLGALVLSFTVPAGAQAPAGSDKQASVTPSTPPPGPVAPPRSEPAANPPAATAPAGTTPQPASALNPQPSELPSPRGAGGSAELDRLLSRVASLRSRVAALTTALFSSKMKLELLASGDGVRVKALRVWVDGGVVYTAPPSASFELPAVVYEHAMAPGPHVVGVEIERYGADNQQFSTWQLSKFVVVVPERRTLWAQLELEDESSMAEDFPNDEEGEYDLRVRLKADVSD